jgi:hypothetical protein
MSNFAKVKLKDQLTFEAECTPTNELRTVEPVRLAGTVFDGGLDTNFWAKYESTGTVGVLGSECILTSGTAANHFAKLTSIRNARFVGGSAIKFRCHVRLGTIDTANVTRRWGAAQFSNYVFTATTTATATVGAIYTNNSQFFKVLKTEAGAATLTTYGSGAPGASGTLTLYSGTGDATIAYTANANTVAPFDGAWFQLAGSTFSVVTMKGGSESKVDSGAFNVTASYTPTLNNTVMEIVITNGGAYFSIGNPGTLYHKTTGSTATWTNSLSPWLYADVINSDASAAVTLNFRSFNISRLGQYTTSPKYHNSTGTGITVLKTSGGILHSITFNNPAAKALKIYDSPAGTVGPLIATITPVATSSPYTLMYNSPFFFGLSIDPSAGAQDVTLIYE